MAFTNTPQTSTYDTKQVRLISELNNRGSNSSTDSDYLNVFFEIVKNQVSKENDYYIIRRPGYATRISPGGTELRGLYYWEDEQILIYCVDIDVFVYNLATNTMIATLPAYFVSNTGEVGFCEYLYDSGVTKVIMTDGTKLSTIDSAGVATPCVDADMPTPHEPHPIFLDGYLFIVKSATADIYNSDLNDPLSYTPGNFISAEMFADKLVRIAKLSNYLVAFGKNSIEYFWDAGNASGSPLQRNDTPVKLNGYLGGFAQLGNKIYFIGNDNESQPDVYFLEDFKIQSTNSQYVKRYFSSLNVNYESYYGSIISSNGHNFYIIHSGTNTYVLELESNLFTRWSTKGATNFPIKFATNTKTSSLYNSFIVFDNDTDIFVISPTYNLDDGQAINWSIITNAEEFESYNNKFMSRLIIWADRPSSTHNVLVQWTDDDYQTYNTGLTINLNQDLPSIRRLGKFRRRAFKLSGNSNTPVRIQGLEVNINKGNS